jgi:flagellar biosynthesis chaperone FliJ
MKKHKNDTIILMDSNVLQYFEEQKFLNDKIYECRQHLDVLDEKVRVNRDALDKLTKEVETNNFYWIRKGLFFERMDKNSTLLELKNSQTLLTKQINNVRKDFRMYSSKLEELEDLETLQKRLDLGV